MTVKLSISVPDDVANYLQSQGNASAAVTDAVRRVLPQARRARQRAAAATTMEAPHTVHISHNTAKSRLFYGLRRLRTALVAQAAVPSDH